MCSDCRGEQGLIAARRASAKTNLTLLEADCMGIAILEFWFRFPHRRLASPVGTAFEFNFRAVGVRGRADSCGAASFGNESREPVGATTTRGPRRETGLHSRHSYVRDACRDSKRLSAAAQAAESSGRM